MAVALVPAEPGRARRRESHLVGFTNADGSFTVTGAPGEYLVLMWQPRQERVRLTEEYVRANGAKAPRVKLGPGERKAVELTAPCN